MVCVQVEREDDPLDEDKEREDLTIEEAREILADMPVEPIIEPESQA